MKSEFYLQAYVDYLELSNKASKTIEIYTPIVYSFLKMCGDDPLKVSKQDIIKFILSKEGTRTRQQCKGALKHLFEGVLQKPGYLKFVPNPKREQYIPNILSQDEAKKVLSNISNKKHHAILNLQYYAALRTGEVISLKVNDIRKDGIVHIRQSKGAKDRLVPVSEEILNTLRNYYKEYSPKHFLFEGQDKISKYSSKSIQAIVKKYCLLNGVKRKIRPHDLRHSRATHLHENGVGIKFIQDLLGHKKVSTTEIYLHTNVQSLKKAILNC
ncbi:site-specific integrase [Flavobacteriaceae bacterium TK19130]|nr:site-specific integrase [Thermobacterium salinum]